MWTCLTNGVGYWRAVGYFTSHGLTLAAKGLATFVNGAGKMRLVASPVLDPSDIEALERGYRTKEDVLERAILRQFREELLRNSPHVIRHRLECLACVAS